MTHTTILTSIRLNQNQYELTSIIKKNINVCELCDNICVVINM